MVCYPRPPSLHLPMGSFLQLTHLSHRGLSYGFCVILGLGKLDTCFKMSKVCLFKDLKKCSNKYKKNAFSMNHWSKFAFFFHWVLFSRNFWMELKRRSLSIRQYSIFINSSTSDLSHMDLPPWINRTSVFQIMRCWALFFVFSKFY